MATTKRKKASKSRVASRKPQAVKKPPVLSAPQTKAFSITSANFERQFSGAYSRAAGGRMQRSQFEGLMLVGLLALSKLKVNQFPEVEPPVLVVNITYPGASPETAEREVVNRIENGQGRMEDLALLDDVADNIAGRTICALGDAAALPVKSFLKHFRHEFEHHIAHKRCMVEGPVIEPLWGRGGSHSQQALQAVVEDAAPTRAAEAA